MLRANSDIYKRPGYFAEWLDALLAAAIDATDVPRVKDMLATSGLASISPAFDTNPDEYFAEMLERDAMDTDDDQRSDSAEEGGPDDSHIPTSSKYT